EANENNCIQAESDKTEKRTHVSIPVHQRTSQKEINNTMKSLTLKMSK
ncbi:12042_t:CDS:2, partial [Entrophospora sp. SA101]